MEKSLKKIYLFIILFIIFLPSCEFSDHMEITTESATDLTAVSDTTKKQVIDQTDDMDEHTAESPVYDDKIYSFEDMAELMLNIHDVCFDNVADIELKHLVYDKITLSQEDKKAIWTKLSECTYKIADYYDVLYASDNRISISFNKDWDFIDITFLGNKFYLKIYETGVGNYINPVFLTYDSEGGSYNLNDFIFEIVKKYRSAQQPTELLKLLQIDNFFINEEMAIVKSTYKFNDDTHKYDVFRRNITLNENQEAYKSIARHLSNLKVTSLPRNDIHNIDNGEIIKQYHCYQIYFTSDINPAKNSYIYVDKDYIKYWYNTSFVYIQLDEYNLWDLLNELFA